MTSSRPYLIRAIYEWIVDNDMTPHLLVDAAAEVMVPRDYVENGRIVLNVAPLAVSGLLISNEAVTFNARFGGRPMNVMIPIDRVLAIYTRENGQGMMFAESEDGDEPPPSGGDDGPGDKGEGGHRKGPSLRVVK
ncbi:ClpXP protease specificity-enhancing factor [Ectothiorhodospira shaposhnikovii]|uniref:ClpXP protease specificity-enhancing factor n=1 Tax=Ectothiorhodospira shaposhnikovii TaxID=1054 RepID=UPI001908438A|nr:ClpXP protease specificity-enhancing factor [Ectothiorhodospira shaposhnikovii]MBK1672535.1 ClpXP protease specificity-enhancing factor [Ectothiorhodospira shaposhnikovii]